MSKERNTVANVSLDPDDAFERAVAVMVGLVRKKRADYALDQDSFSNFRDTADFIGIPGFTPVDSALFNVCQKLARLRSLRINGRMHAPQNEAVVDTYVDLASYACLTMAIALESQR